MSDLHGGPGGQGTDGVAAAPRHGRRVRPGAVPDARTGAVGRVHTLATPPAEPSLDDLLDPELDHDDRDEVIDGHAQRPDGAPPLQHEPAGPEQLPDGTEHLDGGHAEGDDAEGDAGEGDAGEGDDVEGEYAESRYDEGEYAEGEDAEGEDAEGGYPEGGYHAGRRGHRRGRTAVALVVCLALLGGAVYAGWAFVSPIIDRVSAGSAPAQDYPGPGTGEVDVVVAPGDTGGAIGDTLLEAGVVASRAAFVVEFTATPEAASLQPGTYRLRQEMKASEALSLLLDPGSRQSLPVAVPEGLWVSETLVAISEQTGFPVEELQAALADPAVGLPPESGGAAEGYLFPATYDFDPDVTPVQIFASMVARHTQAMDELGVPAEQRRDVLVRASIVQGEASRTEDLAKVARVIENRLGRGETLGMDSTVGYIVQKRALDLTASDLETDSPYNTRIYTGLPPGPINNPGEAAIAAALAPAEGDWLYFVTVNGDTGETVFTADYDEFIAAKQQFQKWLAENG